MTIRDLGEATRQLAAALDDREGKLLVVTGAGVSLASGIPTFRGTDQGATPVEMLLLGLAGCLTAGLANIAAARGVTLRSVESTVEGDIDLQGILGLSKQVRNGFQAVRVTFRVAADCSDEQISQLVAQSQARSAVFDVITNGCPVTVSVER